MTTRAALRARSLGLATSLTAAIVIAALVISRSNPPHAAVGSTGSPGLASASVAPPPGDLTGQASNVPTSAIERDPGGIPLTLAGEAVHIGLDAVAFADATTDSTPFLVGGWFHDGTFIGCSGGIGRDPSPLLSGCETSVGGNAPLTAYAGPQGQMFWDGHVLPGRVGPSIVRVHTHDPRAAHCWSANRPACRLVLVVDSVLWAGDEVTNAAPLSVAAAVQTVASVILITEFPIGPNAHLSVERRLFATPLAAPCPSPWPDEVFRLRSDPRFGVVAVFPDARSRVAAQAALDPANPGCGGDPRVVRVGAPEWVGVKNVLVLVWGDDAKSHVETAFGVGSGNPDQFLPLPPASLDESYRVVDDAEAARAAGMLESPGLAVGGASDVDDAIARFNANALAYVIGPARRVQASDVGSSIWGQLQSGAVPGTPRLYVVDHPDSTAPALSSETVVAFEQKDPGVDTWGFIVVPPGS